MMIVIIAVKDVKMKWNSGAASGCEKWDKR